MKDLEKVGFSHEQAETILKKAAETAGRQRRYELVLWGALLILLFGAGFFLVSNFTNRVNDAAIENCQVVNTSLDAQVRGLERGIFTTKSDIRQAKATDPALFPSIPPKTLDQLIKRRVETLRHVNAQRRHDIHRLPRIPCKKRFP